MRRLALPVATTGVYGALVVLSIWIGTSTDWEKEAGPLWALYLVPHVALGFVAVLWWRWAPLLIVIPVGIGVA